MLLWGCRLGFSKVGAFPQVFTRNKVQSKRLVYFGNLTILRKCLWKEGKVHLGFVFTLSETTSGLLWTAVKYPRQHHHKAWDSCLNYVLKSWEADKGTHTSKEFQLGRGSFFLFPKVTRKLHKFISTCTSWTWRAASSFSCHSWKSVEEKVWLQTVYQSNFYGGVLLVGESIKIGLCFLNCPNKTLISGGSVGDLGSWRTSVWERLEVQRGGEVTAPPQRAAQVSMQMDFNKH